MSRNARFNKTNTVFLLWLWCGAPLLATAQFMSMGPLWSAQAPRPRARVVIASDPTATRHFKADPESVRALFECGLTNFTSRTNVAAAWLSLVSTQDVVGIKVFAAPGPDMGTRTAVVDVVVQGLLSAGLAPNRIIIWDKQIEDLRRAGFVDLAERRGVRVVGSAQAGWDEAVFYESPMMGQLVYGDLEFNKKGDLKTGRKSFVSKLVSKDITRIINVPPLLNHNSAGVCGNLCSLALGSVDNAFRFEGEPLRLAQAVPEIYALPLLGDRVALNVVDALICQYQGEHVGLMHYSTALNQLRFSTDPVALDVLSIAELNKQRELKDIAVSGHTNFFDLYHNASLLEIGVSDPRQIQVETVK